MKKWFFLCFFLGLFLFYSCKKETPKDYTKLQGHAFGTTFNITYNGKQDFTKQIDSLFQLINKSLSTYIPSSDISKINQGDTTIVVDAYFREVYQKSLKIYEETEGIFDPTIGRLVNAWGFGPKKVIDKPDSVQVKEILELIGFDKVQLENGKIKKKNDNIYFDFNAIAKGYAVDIAGRFLEENKVQDYLVEIGGEIRTKGIKLNGEAWQVGIEEPNFDGSRSLQKVIALKDEAMATSGSYRKFKVDSITGKKYVHIINPKTGYADQGELLSVSVIGKTDCADVDGYATAFMAMSLEKIKQLLKKHQELRVYIIYSNAQGELETYATENF